MTGSRIEAVSPTFWCEVLFIAGSPVERVRIVVGSDGLISGREVDVEPQPGDMRLGTVLPGLANAHSHAFHRALRGRTHDDGGDFWQWRTAMYDIAARLTPERYYVLARAVFAEMLVSGFTAVGEFHYVHHNGDGSPQATDHAMELAVARAASDVGIRLVLLDTCYLAGGIGEPIQAAQRAFDDGSVEGWLARWNSLRTALGNNPDRRVSLGAAAHSVRAVTPDQLGVIARGIPTEVPLHIHLSEQPKENSDCVDAYGLTPTQVLQAAGLLAPRLSVVHATHLTEGDIELLGFNGVAVVMCPTTEADLGDGIGPALRLAHAGAAIALGSDQNAVIDPLLEMRGLEMGERLASRQRGRFSPAEILTAASANGYRSLGLGSMSLLPGDLCDLVEIATDSLRTMGSATAGLPLSATASDVRRVIVHGEIVAESGLLTRGGNFDVRPQALMAAAIDALALGQ